MAGDHVGRQQPLLLKPGSTEDVFQLEAVRFLPVSAKTESVEMIF